MKTDKMSYECVEKRTRIYSLKKGIHTTFTQVKLKVVVEVLECYILHHTYHIDEGGGIKYGGGGLCFLVW